MSISIIAQGSNWLTHGVHTEYMVVMGARECGAREHGHCGHYDGEVLDDDATVACVESRHFDAITAHGVTSKCRRPLAHDHAPRASIAATFPTASAIASLSITKAHCSRANKRPSE